MALDTMMSFDNSEELCYYISYRYDRLTFTEVDLASGQKVTIYQELPLREPWIFVAKYQRFATEVCVSWWYLHFRGEA
jgi:hypothetical protein